MTKKYQSIFSVLLLAFALAAVCFIPKPTQQLTPERAATHFIRYVKEGVDSGYCTGTAIAPHAMLTASHCDEGSVLTIQLDRGEIEYHILAATIDGRDHTIYILDGPAFRNYIEIKPRNPRMGEQVVSYGTGHSDFPPHTYYGKVIPADNGGDQSDVDEDIGATTYSLTAIPGDSGSAVYGKDGSILGLVTYGDSEEKEAIGFPLAFPIKIYGLLKEINIDGNHNSGSSTKPTSDTGAGSSSKTP